MTNDGLSPRGTRSTFPLHWLWVLIPGAVLLWAPLRLCAPLWIAKDSQVVFQAWIPLIVILLCWARRREWQRTANELAELFPDPRDPRRSGNLVMVIVGGLGLLFGLVSSVPAASTFFLCIMIFGACLALAGPFLLRVVLTPLLYLLLMIPFPSSVILALVVRFQLTGAAMLGGALELLSTKNRVLGPEVTMQSTGYPLTVSPSLSGVGTFFFAITATLAYLLWRRSSFGRGLVALIITAFISCLVSVLRLLILGEVASSNPSMADLLGKIPALPAILIVWALTWLFTRKLLSPRPKVQPEVAA